MHSNQAYLDQMQQTSDAIAIRYPHADPAQLDTVGEGRAAKLNMQHLLRETNAKFGATCWHINEDELDAMWQLYVAAGNGIAIESQRRG